MSGEDVVPSPHRPSLAVVIAAVLTAIALLTVLDLVTDRLDADQTIRGQPLIADHVAYVEMARSKIMGNKDRMIAPFAYRVTTPLLARWISGAARKPVSFGFLVVTYLGLFGQLLFVFLLAFRLGQRTDLAFFAMLVVAGSMFNLKFPLYDTFRPDTLALMLIPLAMLLVLRSSYVWAAGVAAFGLIGREFCGLAMAVVVVCLAREWWRTRQFEAGALLFFVVLVGAAALALPRVAIDVAFSLQWLDPINEPRQAWKVFVHAMLLSGKRHGMMWSTIAFYLLPLWMIGTRQRWRQAWTLLGEHRLVFGTYLATYVALHFIGGGDHGRFAAYLFVPQVALLMLMLKDERADWEIALVIAAVLIFNRVWFDFSRSVPGAFTRPLIGPYVTTPLKWSHWPVFAEFFGCIAAANALRRWLRRAGSPQANAGATTPTANGRAVTRQSV